MADVTSWVGIVVFACGIYCLYATIMMKTKGEINQRIYFDNIAIDGYFDFKQFRASDLSQCRSGCCKESGFDARIKITGCL